MPEGKSRMNKYIGKVCPFCKSEFVQGDNIVLCSACDMPHHRDCWIENQGCTTFGCLGTIQSVDDTANTVTEEEMIYEDIPRQTAGNVFCTRCGAPNTAAFSFCSRCGNRLTGAGQIQTAPVYPQINPVQNSFIYANQAPVYQQPVYNQNAGIDPDIAGLIGTNIHYYLPIFQKMMSRNEKTSWNWAAFFFAPYWFLYRKMYGYGIAALSGSFLPVLLDAPSLFVFLLAGYIVIGIFANYIYMKELEKWARRAKAWSEPYHSQFIFRNSGGNALAAVLAVIGYFMVNILFTYYYFSI